MTAGRLRFLLGAGAALTAALVDAASQAQTRSCQPPQAAHEVLEHLTLGYLTHT